jgi:hypothetical protein
LLLVQGEPIANIVAEPSEPTQLELSVALPIALICFLPALVFLCVWLASRLCLSHQASHAVRRVVYPVLRALDQVGDWKTGYVGKSAVPLHWEATELGGACSCTGIGVIAALCAVIIIVYTSSANSIISAYLQLARPATVSEFNELSVFTLAAFERAALMPALTGGLLVQVAVMGAQCGSATVNPDAQLFFG